MVEVCGFDLKPKEIGCAIGICGWILCSISFIIALVLTIVSQVKYKDVLEIYPQYQPTNCTVTDSRILEYYNPNTNDFHNNYRAAFEVRFLVLISNALQVNYYRDDTNVSSKAAVVNYDFGSKSDAEDQIAQYPKGSSYPCNAPDDPYDYDTFPCCSHVNDYNWGAYFHFLL